MLIGTFLSVTGIPEGMSINYAFAGGTQIALVSAIPEPSTLVLALFGLLSLGLVARPRRRRA